MKSFFVSAFILIVFTGNATTYYLSANGNDAANGTSILTSWKTLNKLNSVFATLNPGDNVLFKKGDVFSGSLIISRSGLPGSPITIGAYGKGANPLITGFATVSGWTALKNNIWESTSVVSTLASCNMVVINGINTPMGRYPNTGWLTYTTPTSSSISCASLNSAGTNWTGAEAVIRKNDFAIDRCTISHSGTVITFSSLGGSNNPTNNYGFFIQNDERTLDVQNEWYYNPSTKKIRVYSSSMPANVKVSTVSNLLTDAGFAYITVDGLNFTGSNGDALVFGSSNCDHIIIQNCTINFSGNMGININGVSDVIDNNLISNTAEMGILSGGANVTVTRNTIQNIGAVVGQALAENLSRGVRITGNTGGLVQYNTIRSTGFHGISTSSNVTQLVIRNNFIDSAVNVLNDGGGIYMGGNKAATSIIIDGNIVINSVGNIVGTPATNLAEGIYLDELTSHITVTNNTVANCGDAGIKLHKSNTNTINNNTSFNNYKVQITYQDATDGVIHDNVMKNNIFFAKTSTQYAFGGHSSNNDIPTFFSVVDSNYYMRPVDDDLVFNISQPGAKNINRNLTGWQTMIGKDTHSPKSPVAITDVNDLILEYNPTRVPLTISLPSEYIDVKNVSYKGTITLAPYTSAVLIKAGAGTKRRANEGTNQNRPLERKDYFAAGKVISYITLANCGFTPLCYILMNVAYYYPFKPATQVYSNLVAVLRIIFKNGDFGNRNLSGI